MGSAGKAVLRGKFITVSVYIKKEKRCHINNLIYNCKALKKKMELNQKLVGGTK